MKIGSIVAVLALAAVSSCAMAQSVVREYHTNIKLNVDTHGQVVKVGTPAKLPAMLVPSVRKAAAQWRFKAPEVHGTAVAATTWAFVDVELVKRKSKGYGVNVVYTGNGPKVTRRYAPRYPTQARRARDEGEVLLQASVQPDGSFADVHMVHSEGNGVGALARAARRAFRMWHAQPMRLNGKPVATRIQVAFNFTLHECSGGSSCHEHASLTATASKPKPAWANTPSGQIVATDSPLQRVPDARHL